MSPIASLYLAWAMNATWPIVGKEAGRYFHPLLYGVSALILALILMIPALLKGGRWRRLIEPPHWKSFLVLGGLGSGITTVLLLAGVAQTTAANAAIVCQVEVVYSAILAAWLLRERITGRQMAASALVLAGTAIILSRDLGTPHWKGDLIILLTPWMFQVSHVFAKRLPPDLDAVTIACGRMFYGVVVLLPFAVWTAFTGGRFEASPTSLGLLAFQVLVLNVGSILFWYRAVRHLPLAKTTAIMLSYPALTLVYCWILGTEPVGGHQVAGLILSMAGAVWLTLQVAPPAASVAQAAAEP